MLATRGQGTHSRRALGGVSTGRESAPGAPAETRGRGRGGQVDRSPLGWGWGALSELPLLRPRCRSQLQAVNGKGLPGRSRRAAGPVALAGRSHLLGTEGSAPSRPGARNARKPPPPLHPFRRRGLPSAPPPTSGALRRTHLRNRPPPPGVRGGFPAPGRRRRPDPRRRPQPSSSIWSFSKRLSFT